MKKEVRGIIERGKVKFFVQEDMKRDANFLPGCSVLPINYGNHGALKLKSRSVIGGNRENMNKIGHYSQELQHVFVQLLLSHRT